MKRRVRTILPYHLGAVADDLEDVVAATLFAAECVSDRGVTLIASRWAERLAQIAVHMRHVVATTWVCPNAS